MKTPDLNDELRGGVSLDALLDRAAPVSSTEEGVALDSRFYVTNRGTFSRRDGGDAIRICGPLRLLGSTRDASNLGWGVFVEWFDDDGKRHREVIGRKMLAGEGAEVVGRLAEGGLDVPIDRPGRQLLLAYLASATPRRIRTVNRLGWYGGAYVLDDECFGEADERLYYDGPKLETGFSEKGSLAEWNAHVVSLAQGNSRLLLALATAVAGPMLNRLGVNGFGVHFVGPSSSGKTTTGLVAASVYSDPERFKRTWHVTANGLEGVARQHNDGMLFLDELSQCDPEHAAAAAYMLANGAGKQRAKVDGAARDAVRWRLSFLSTGEETLEARLRSGGMRTNAGQEVRLLNVPAPAKSDHGFFEELHGQDAASFAESVSSAASVYHGTALRPWLRALAALSAAEWSGLGERLNELRDGLLPVRAEGQAKRVARAFAVLALAGEVAIEKEVLSLPPGTVLGAVEACFDAWLDGFGLGSREDRTALEDIRALIANHELSRFERCPSDPRTSIPNRLGYVFESDNEEVFAFEPTTFRREVCKGRDAMTVARMLLRLEILKPDEKGNASARKQRLPGKNDAPRRLYVLRASVLAEVET